MKTLKKINWGVRARNPKFWIALFAAVLLAVQTIGAPFGYQWDFVVLNEQLTAIINAVFGVLMVLGIVNDPTTEGFTDSERALTYEKPAGDEKYYGKHEKKEG